MDKWLKWATEIQSIGQIGLAYCKDKFDRERYERLRELSAEIMSEYTDIEIERVEGLFCNEEGYQTPKIDVRAVIFKKGKILLIKEGLTNKWALPGGWADINQSLSENVEREAKEEAGLNVKAKKIIAVQDRNRHNEPQFVYTIYKIFVLCDIISGEFEENIETTESGYFNICELPELDTDKINKEQVEMCFDALNKEYIESIFD